MKMYVYIWWSLWLFKLTPSKYVRKSSEGLSLLFVVLWLAGDVFNVLGAILQHVLPTMIILAIYYTLADLILLGQIFLYGDGSQVDPVHLSPANPLSENIFDEVLGDQESQSTTSIQYSQLEQGGVSNTKQSNKKSRKRTLIESSLIFFVILSGIIGWYISYNPDQDQDGDDDDELKFDFLAQFFGWLSAILYLGSRMPQILLNFKRKSCEGISFLFFLCACLGNLTYVISILSISVDPYFLLVQSSWLAGSIGTLSLDFVIFVQFFLYNRDGEDSDDSDIDEITD